MPTSVRPTAAISHAWAAPNNRDPHAMNASPSRDARPERIGQHTDGDLRTVDVK
jgi:hypothetical protein